ncbi:MAG: hypothetical protein HUU21_17975 [Polyangiaceae bacterium]|nr:hypothetical protein [Polyangiaceae bacterium]
MIGLLGGACKTAVMLGIDRGTLHQHIHKGRMPMALYKRLREAAIQRFAEIIKEAPR